MHDRSSTHSRAFEMQSMLHFAFLTCILTTQRIHISSIVV